MIYYVKLLTQFYEVFESLLNRSCCYFIPKNFFRCYLFFKYIINKYYYKIKQDPDANLWYKLLLGLVNTFGV